MVEVTRIGNSTIWEFASDDPQELAIASTTFSWDKVDPEQFKKDPDGKFRTRKDLPGTSKDKFPWDKIRCSKRTP